MSCFREQDELSLLKRLITERKIALGVTAMTLVALAVTTPIIGHETTGQTDGFVNNSMTALAGWMLQHKIASYIALSIMAAVNVGAIVGAGYFAFKKAKAMCPSSERDTFYPSLDDSFEYDQREFPPHSLRSFS